MKVLMEMKVLNNNLTYVCMKLKVERNLHKLLTIHQNRDYNKDSLQGQNEARRILGLVDY